MSRALDLFRSDTPFRLLLDHGDILMEFKDEDGILERYRYNDVADAYNDVCFERGEEDENRFCPVFGSLKYYGEGELPETLYMTDYMIGCFLMAAIHDVFNHPEKYAEYAVQPV